MAAKANSIAARKAPPRKSVRPIRGGKPARTAVQQQPHSKLDRIVAALRAPKGASITDLMALTGWQMHSVRGAIAGALKKKRGLDVHSACVAGERRYRIGAAP